MHASQNKTFDPCPPLFPPAPLLRLSFLFFWFTHWQPFFESLRFRSPGGFEQSAFLVFHVLKHKPHKKAADSPNLLPLSSAWPSTLPWPLNGPRSHLHVVTSLGYLNVSCPAIHF